jgi:hypothetical protein
MLVLLLCHPQHHSWRLFPSSQQREFSMDNSRWFITPLTEMYTDGQDDWLKGGMKGQSVCRQSM